MLELLFGLTAVVTASGLIWGVVGARDTLHPLVYLMPMSAFLYVYMPVNLYQKGSLQALFSADHLIFVQVLNLVCVTALAVGCYVGSRPIRRQADRIDLNTYRSTPEWLSRLYKLALVFGLIGFGLYVYQLGNVGGFVDAYSHSKGGGSASSGYARDLILLVIPGILFLYMSRFRKRMRNVDLFLLAIFASPLLVHGLLSGRRGPTFLALATLIAGRYFTRSYRPSLTQVAVGGGLIGVLLLALVSFRGEIYLGSDLFSGDGPSATEFVDRIAENRTKSSYENEFIYGAYVVQQVREEGYFYYGMRYITQIFVRPIPSQIWQNKYRDIGMEAILVNAGILGPGGLEAHPNVPPGAAPGFVGSAYVEFAWGAVLFVFLIGWIYGRTWRNGLVFGGIWTVVYVTLLSLSAYFIAQSFLAVLFRLLLTCIPAALAWNAAWDRYQRETSSPSVHA